MRIRIAFLHLAKPLWVLQKLARRLFAPPMEAKIDNLCINRLSGLPLLNCAGGNLAAPRQICIYNPLTVIDTPAGNARDPRHRETSLSHPDHSRSSKVPSLPIFDA